MTQFLKTIYHVSEMPKDCHMLKNMAGGLYYVTHKEYLKFSRNHILLFMDDTRKHLTMDLCCAQQHSLIFDFDGKVDDQYIDQTIIPVFKNLFITLGHFTFIAAIREERGGIHIHFPEMMIAHDDYVRLCTQLQPLFQTRQVRLDIPSNWTLSRSSKVATQPYQPSRVYYMDEQREYMFKINVSQLGHTLHYFKSVKEHFKKRKDNMNSFFRKLLNLPTDQVLDQVYEYMMPVATPHSPLHRLSYSTLVARDDDVDSEKIAHFWDRHDNLMYIHKGNELNFKGVHWLRSYYFIQYNSFTIKNFETENSALKTWYKRFKESHAVFENEFQEVNLILKQDQYAFKDDKNPIATLLQYDDGYYFLCVFYALVGYLQIHPTKLISLLRNIVNCEALLDRLEEVDPKLISVIAEGLSLDTILYCGSNMGNRSVRMKDRIAAIVRSMRGLIFSVSTSEQMVDILRRIQERHFPILMVSMRNSCKKPVRYMWNPMNHCWQEMTSENDVRNIINTIYLQISTFVKSNSVSNEFLKNLKLSLLVSSILSETNNERRVVEMDRHKWFIRTREGILDILTGHVGATVPEFFISDRQLGVEFGKTLLESFRVDPDHIALYRLLTQRKFFRKFQIHLYEDLTDDVYDTLQETVWRELPNKNDPIHDSMLHCFTHLCKYLSFEYDRLMYMLDVLSSLLVATNYARKFFIFKGVTRNGKSKFFQMIARVFGSYSHTIRNVNLQPSTGCNQVAQPELAMTMFTCRIVTVEEMSGKLNENLVKEITGNSTTSFRNLFEQHTGGIPSAKIFASANTIPICTASEAFKDRVVVFPFETTFTKEASSMPTSEQVRLDEFPLDTSDSVIEDSYKGFFLLLYLHMILHINKKNGTVTYGREPDSLLEYKEEFLTPTDIYTQFKIYADVQLAPGHCTTLTDLKSAIRQFLKTIKNTSIEETEIVLKFDDEFKDYRRCEPQLMNSFLFEAEDDIPISFQRDDEDVDEEVSQKKRSLEEDEEAGPSQKKQKLEEEEEVSQKKRKIMDEEAGPSQKKQKLGQEEEVRPSQKKRKIMDNLEEEQSGVSKKKRKLNRLEIGAPQRSIVYYHNVLIKNLKKEKMRYS